MVKIAGTAKAAAPRAKGINPNAAAISGIATPTATAILYVRRLAPLDSGSSAVTMSKERTRCPGSTANDARRSGESGDACSRPQRWQNAAPAGCVVWQREQLMRPSFIRAPGPSERAPRLRGEGRPSLPGHDVAAER